jgi:hypothetical protein
MPSFSDYTQHLEGVLINAAATGTTTGVTVKVKPINGANPTWLTGAHRVTVVQKTRTQTKVEVWGVASATQSGATVTLGTLTRALSLSDGTDFTGTGTAQSFTAGALVYVTLDVRDAEQMARKDLANTFTNDNTLATTKKWYLGDTGNYIKGTAGGDIALKSNTTTEKTLADLAAAVGSDEKVLVSVTDTTRGYLLAKIPNPTNGGIVMTQTGGGGDETLVPSINLDTNPGLVLGSNKLKAKVKANSGITLDADGLSIATQGAAGTILTSTGASSAPTFQSPVHTVKVVAINVTASSALSNPTSVTAFDTGTYTIPANDLVAGVAYEFEATGTVTYGTSGAFDLTFMLDTVAATYSVGITSTSTHNWKYRGKIMGTTAAGATSAVLYEHELLVGAGNVGVDFANRHQTENFATNAQHVLKIGAIFGTSHGNNAATLTSAVIRKISTTAF